MPVCERLEKCPFFNNAMKDMPVMSELYKRQYCMEDNSTCARYLVIIALGPKDVPEDLVPHQEERARKIIARKRSLLAQSGKDNSC